MAQLLRPISTITDQGNYTGATAHGSVDGTAPDTGDYWNGNDNQTDVLEVLLTDLSASEPGGGTCTVSIYETVSDTDSAPAAGGSSVTYDLEVYEGATQRAARTGITPTDSTFTLDNNLTFAASAITDWSNVRVRFTSYGTGGAPAGRRGAAISYIDISAPDAGTNVSYEVTGAAITGAAQAPSDVTGDVNYTLTGSEAGADAGTSIAEVPRPTVGPFQFASHGLNVNTYGSFSKSSGDVSGEPAGAAITAAASAPTVQLGVDYTLTGAAITAASGTISVTTDTNYTLSGASIGAASGTVTAATEVSYTLTGAAGAGESGTVTVTADVNQDLTGAASAAATTAASVTADSSISATGAAISADAGSVSADAGGIPQLSPLTLAIRRYGSFKNKVSINRAYAPWGLSVRDYGTFRGKLQTTSVVGKSSNAEAGTVNVVTTTNRQVQLAPHGLVTYPRSFSKQVGQNPNVAITGAEIQGQQSHPDLSQPTVYIDGAAISADGGSVEFAQALLAGAASSVDAGTVTADPGVGANPAGAAIGVESGEVTGVGSGGTNAAPTVTAGTIAGNGGTASATNDSSFSVSGAEINAQASEPGIDTNADVSVTVYPATIGVNAGTVIQGAFDVERPSNQGKGRRSRRRPRYLVEVDGQTIIVHTQAEAIALLEQAAQIAEETVLESRPVIRVLTGTKRVVRAKKIRAALENAQRRVDQAFNARAEEIRKWREIDAEISRLMLERIALEEQDEEDAIIALLS